MTPNFAISVVAMAVAGCASTSPKQPFRDTAGLVEARTGRRIAWNEGGDDDAAVSKVVHDLLSRELTVEAAIQVALLNNKTLQATYEDLSIAQADLVQAGLLQNPSFGAGIALPVAGSASTGGILSVSQDFLSVFVLAARKKVAAAQLLATKLRVGNAVLLTTYEVECAFYNLGAAQQVAAMRKTILDAGDAALDLARRQHDAGNINDLDLVNQEAVYEQVRADLVRSDADVVVARETLTRLLGVWGADATYTVEGKLPELPPEEVGLERLESLAVGRRLDLGATHEEAQAISHSLALAKNYRWLGSASAGASYERSPEGFSVAGPAVGLELPIFDQRRAVIARLEAQLRAALAPRDGARGRCSIRGSCGPSPRRRHADARGPVRQGRGAAPRASRGAVARAVQRHAARRLPAPPDEAERGERLPGVHRGAPRLLDRPRRPRTRHRGTVPMAPGTPSTSPQPGAAP